MSSGPRELWESGYSRCPYKERKPSWYNTGWMRAATDERPRPIAHYSSLHFFFFFLVVVGGVKIGFLCVDLALVL